MADELDALIAARRSAASGAATPPAGDDLDTLIASRRAASGSPPATPDAPGVLSRARTMIKNAASQALHHPIDTAASLIEEPLKSLNDAVFAPGVGEMPHDPRLSKAGKSFGVPVDLTKPLDAAHGAVTMPERLRAGTAVATDLAFPGVSEVVGEKLASLGLNHVVAKLGGLAAAGAGAGAANNSGDPGAGAITGAVLAPATQVAGSATGKLVGLGFRGASAVRDMAGRPAETVPVTVMGKQITTIPNLSDRAADLNARDLAKTPLTDGLPVASKKPVTPMDVAGTSGLRLARGLKTLSPGAESVFQDALRERGDAAADRVIQHGLETTGLASRENGLQVVDDMIAQRTQHGNESYRPVFEKYTQPIDNPEFAAIAKTPAGKQALARAATIAANRGEQIGSITEAAPAGKTGDLIERAGADPMAQPDQVKRLAPTLQQAHYVKLAFDDMLNSPPEPGSGGSGPNNVSAIRTLKSRWVGAMDNAAPEYKSARAQFADESDLIRAAELGRNLWKLHPAEAEKAMGELPKAAQDVARRTGFDALAERVENGPSDVERGVAKPRDVRRMRLLFPDDASFADFRQGLSEEARMHGNAQGILGGSNTADKLNDMASMAGIELPDMVRAAATGRWKRLAGQAAANVVRKGMTSGLDELSAERARLLMAGSGGNPSDRISALMRMKMVPDNTAHGPLTAQAEFARTMGDAFAEHYRTQFLPGAAGLASGGRRE